MPHVIAGAAITLLLIVAALAPRSSAAQPPPATLGGVAVVVRPASPSAEEIGLPTYQEIVAGLPPEPARPAESPAGAERVRSHELPIWGNRVYSAATTAANFVGVYEVSPGMRAGVIPAGGSWSFNENWWSDVGSLATEYDTLGAGVCDVAATYADAAHQAGLVTSFQDHSPIDLAYAPSYANVAIWGTPGSRGGQDLVVTNNDPQGRDYHFQASIEGGVYVVEGWFQ